MEKELQIIILPLFSDRSKIKIVHQKSGINQWNAGGRKRHPREVYIRVPAWIHQIFTSFFPPKDVIFELLLPNNKCIKVKMCQAGRKALMSTPNKDLGEWLLDDVLEIPEWELVTYELLKEIGIDSVKVSKNGKNQYSIDIAPVGSFEKFESDFRIN